MSATLKSNSLSWILPAAIVLAATLPLHAGANAAQNDEQSREARSLLEKVVERYREARTLADTLDLSVDGDTMQITMQFGADNENIALTVPGWRVYQSGSDVYVLTDAVPEKYLQTERNESLHATLVSLFGADPNLPFQFAARDGRQVDDVIGAFGLNILQMPRLMKVEQVEKDGQRYHQLTLQGLGGEMTVDVDEDHLVQRARIELAAPEGTGTETIVAEMTFSPVIADELPGAIAFDPQDRERVDSAEELMPPMPEMVEVGQPAPDFELETIDGKKVTLKELRGSVVVLDFWATWCGPCIQAMPMIDALASWAHESDQPVKVFAVNIWENERQFDRRKEKIKDFWQQRDYKALETLLDPEDEAAAAYGLNSIPATVVIRPDGVVHKVHVGYTPRLKELLEKAAREAIDAAG